MVELTAELGPRLLVVAVFAVLGWWLREWAFARFVVLVFGLVIGIEEFEPAMLTSPLAPAFVHLVPVIFLCGRPPAARVWPRGDLVAATGE